MTKGCVGNSSSVNGQPQPAITTPAVIPNPITNFRWLTPKNLSGEGSLPARKGLVVDLHFGQDFSILLKRMFRRIINDEFHLI